MRRLLTRISLLILLVLTTLLAVVLIPVDATDHFLLALIDKENRLQQLDSPKMIILGGSNTVFNIDSRRIADAMDYSVANLGMHAGLGLMLHLNQVRSYIRAGDMVVIMPEYAQFYRQLFFGGRTVTRLVMFYPQYFRYIINWRQYLEILKGLGLETRSKLVYLLGRSAYEETYRRSAFNEFGDLNPALIGDQPQEKLKYEHYEIRNLADINHAAVRELNKFYDYVGKRGARVYLAFPPVPLEKYAANRQEIEELETYLEDNLEIPVLYQPVEVLLPAKEFYDTFYHLNTLGREHYTHIFLNYFKR
ncbi:MAG TPA: hypothetical protein ENN20_00690 [Candidatus Marinimicrobia bacterium]|nr:hypothetical protein [Candidatus Neomarinimicrobiota bacterium]